LEAATKEGTGNPWLAISVAIKTRSMFDDILLMGTLLNISIKLHFLLVKNNVSLQHGEV